MIIRKYHAKDLDSLTSLMEDLGYPTSRENMMPRMERIQSNPMYFTFVAEASGAVVGMIGVHLAHYYEDDGCATYISALVTKREYQGKGIGTSLMRYVEEWAREQGSNTIVLTSGIKEERLKAHAFYKARGFEINGYRFVKKFNLV
ncbi:GNAT family N-acetyltransferase [Paenibacillus sp. DYY-L-2]|uniref:GNAT family N-acetyltransferase n=1 Tax=Paenibacillus sp. DYY-L-2 TaxID=3447013 RepID=UPI003F50CC58